MIHTDSNTNMKRFIITQEMLGRKEIVSLITGPISKNVMTILKKESENDEQTGREIGRFLQTFGLVRWMLQKDKANKLMSKSVQSAIDYSKQLPERFQRLLGPQIDSLMQIAPRIGILSEIKYYIESDVYRYMYTRDYCPFLLEDTVCVLDEMDKAKESISEKDYLKVMDIFRDELLNTTASLYGETSFLRPVKTSEHDVIAREAFETIRNDGIMSWAFDVDEVKGLIEKTSLLGYKESEMWALKVLTIRNICSLFHWKVLPDNNPEKAKMLQYACELGEGLFDSPLLNDQDRVSHIAAHIQQMLDDAKEKITIFITDSHTL